MNRLRANYSTVLNTINNTVNKFKAPRNDGKALEEVMQDLLSKEGFRDVQLNNRVKDVHGNWSEIDVIAKNRRFYNRFFTFPRHIPWGSNHILVECKQYGPEHRVSLGDVSKFKEVLQLNKQNLKDGLFVTTSAYVPRATTIGINTVDGAQLAKWARKHKKRSPAVQKFSSSFTVATTVILAFLYAQMVFDLREARTKTMTYIEDVQNVEDFKADLKKYGTNGFVVTTGQSPQERFSTLVNTFDFIVYFGTLAIYKALGKDTKDVKQPKREPISPTTNDLKTFVAPKQNSLYMAYELHRPFPTQQPQRQNAFDEVNKLAENEYKSSPILKKIPPWFLSSKNFANFRRFSVGYDYVLFNANLPEFPAKFIPTSLSTEYFQVNTVNGQTYFKIPISHCSSVPGYFGPFLAYKLSQLKKFTDQFDSKVISNPALSQGTWTSPTGSLMARFDGKNDADGTGKNVVFNEHTNKSSFGDSFFTKQFNNDNSITKSKSNNDDFTYAAKPRQYTRETDYFNSSTKNVNRDTISFVDDNSHDDFGESIYLNPGYIMRHGADDDE